MIKLMWFWIIVITLIAVGCSVTLQHGQGNKNGTDIVTQIDSIIVNCKQ